MIALAIALLVIGTALICLEMFLPGFGISGVTGIALVVISAIMTVYATPLGLYIVIAEIILLGVAIQKPFGVQRTGFI